MIDIPKSLALFSAEGDHAGFILFAPTTDGFSGDCVFMLSPMSVEGIDSHLGVFVSELNIAGEHKFIASVMDDTIDIFIQTDGFPEVCLSLSSDLSGYFMTKVDGRDACLGTVETVNRSPA